MPKRVRSLVARGVMVRGGAIQIIIIFHGGRGAGGMVGKQPKLCNEIIGQFLRKLVWETGSFPDGKRVDGLLKEFLDYSILTSMEKK